MKFAYNILYVEDVSKTVQFYRSAFHFDLKFQYEQGDYAELESGYTTLAFSSFELIRSLGKTPHRANAQNPTFELIFVTDSLEEDLQRAKQAGAKEIQGIEKMPWGQSIAYVEDINGFLIELCTPMMA
ncbi:VOC family protein [Acinetobacter larvae]|uniref:Glyoxalase n=1 Tax=Acinetobacter larvae TaxID=1789224 RepID=A0A1B2M1N5_9GAMM|nr:VOC family protein [Acinetobacter larvae]AOA59105.1 glyoxalase [Acinetobacter larvae]